jgi:hypothetical protein
MNPIKRLWRAWVHRFDKRILGRAIDKAAAAHNAPDEYKHYAWAMHKLYDPNYSPEDFTEEEKAALKKYNQGGKIE